MRFLLALCLVLFPLVSFAGPYIELYPYSEDSKLYGPIDVITCVDGDLVGTDCGNAYTMYGAVIQVDSGTITLPAVAQGMWACVKSTTAATINIDANANDRWVLDGTALEDGDKLTSAGTIDDTVCFYGDSADGWTTVHNPDSFTDGN